MEYQNKDDIISFCRSLVHFKYLILNNSKVFLSWKQLISLICPLQLIFSFSIVSVRKICLWFFVDIASISDVQVMAATKSRTLVFAIPNQLFILLRNKFLSHVEGEDKRFMVWVADLFPIWGRKPGVVSESTYFLSELSLN